MGLTIERKKATRKKKIPDSFIYEILDGKPLYYKGYKKAIRNHQNPESIMGASTLQSHIAVYLLKILLGIYDDENYTIFTNEPGLHIDHRNNLAGDILVYKSKDLPVSKLSSNYSNIPALLHIEVDVQAELEDISETGYISRKTNKLLQFGTEKIIWILTAAKSVMIAEKGKDWIWQNWDKPVTIEKDKTFNIGAYLLQKGYNPAK